MNKIPEKGYLAEEALLSYFIKVGRAFAVRGIKVTIDESEVTDIDLYLYFKTSTFVRQSINVDVKNKKSPEALSRIIWTKGLQEIYKFDSCIVASTENREYVKSFAEEHGVRFIDGNLLKEIIKFNTDADRISKDVFEDELRQKHLSVFHSVKKCESLLISNVKFRDLNVLISSIKETLILLEENQNHNQILSRVLILYISYFLILLDKITFAISFKTIEEKEKIIANGIRYGSLNISELKKYISMFSTLAEKFTGQAEMNKNIEATFWGIYESIPAELISKFVCRQEILKSLFELGCQAETIAFSKDELKLEKLNVAITSLVFLFCDFHKIGRKDVGKNFDS